MFSQQVENEREKKRDPVEGMDVYSCCNVSENAQSLLRACFVR